jgi:hypothetical protein
LEASEEEKKRMQVMYGVKVLNKLIAAWEAETANRDYLRDNTVHTRPYVANLRRLAQLAASQSKNPPGAIKWFAMLAKLTSVTSAARISPPSPHACPFWNFLISASLTPLRHMCISGRAERARGPVVKVCYLRGLKTMGNGMRIRGG